MDKRVFVQTTFTEPVLNPFSVDTFLAQAIQKTTDILDAKVTAHLNKVETEDGKIIYSKSSYRIQQLQLPSGLLADPTISATVTICYIPH